ncbi:MAG: hypothetical protein K2Q20_13405, partial [Phycisphaerales bacterium]|nr:hypothetical protein [Phycisphaerales bacterium]
AVMFTTGWLRNRGAGGLWPDFVPATGLWWVLGLVAVYVLLIIKRLNSLGRGPRVAEKIARYGALWLPIYGAAWLLSSGDLRGGLVLSVVAGLGLLGMTVLREAAALLEHPMGYRR